jgi:serine/threonine protein kinase
MLTDSVKDPSKAYALKFPTATSQSKAQEFAREVAITLAAGNNEHVIHCLGVFWARRPGHALQVAMLTDCHKGGDLKDHISIYGRFTPRTSLTRFSGLLAALVHIHWRGILHRDVKPENILLGEDGRFVLTDFGIATFMTDTNAMANRCGSPGHIAPEILGNLPIDGRADVFGAGVVLFYLLTGFLPFQGRTPIATLRRNQRCVVPYDHPACAIIAKHVRSFMFALLSKERASRPIAAAALKQLLGMNFENVFLNMTDKEQTVENGPVQGSLAHWSRKSRAANVQPQSPMFQALPPQGPPPDKKRRPFRVPPTASAVGDNQTQKKNVPTGPCIFGLDADPKRLARTFDPTKYLSQDEGSDAERKTSEAWHAMSTRYEDSSARSGSGIDTPCNDLFLSERSTFRTEEQGSGKAFNSERYSSVSVICERATLERHSNYRGSSESVQPFPPEDVELTIGIDDDFGINVIEHSKSKKKDFDSETLESVLSIAAEGQLAVVRGTTSLKSASAQNGRKQQKIFEQQLHDSDLQKALKAKSTVPVPAESSAAKSGVSEDFADIDDVGFDCKTSES